MAARRILVLAGTTEAAELVRVVAPACDVTASFAGRTTARGPLPGGVRVGGFGGADGLAAHLREEGVDALVDATHPFAARMPWNAHRAAAAAGVPRLRLLRPAWEPGPGDRWHDVADLDAAAAAVRELGARRVFLTTGRQELAPFAALTAWFLVRAIEAPDPLPLAHAEIVLARGPFDVTAERALMVEHRVDLVVTKNSGAKATAAKLAAARELGLPVVMVHRPPGPPGPVTESVAAAARWALGT